MMSFSKSYLTTIFVVSSLLIVSCSNSKTEKTETSQEVLTTDNMLSEPKADSLVLNDAWVRPAPKGAMSAMYAYIYNGDEANDTLISASSDFTGRIELHETYQKEEGVKGMRHVDQFIIPTKEERILKPGGLHLMLFDLKSDLNVGEEVTIELLFNNAGKKIVKAQVKQANL